MGLPRTKVSYSTRLFLWLLAYSLLLVGCFVLFQYRREKQFKAGEMNAVLQCVNHEIADRINSGARDIVPAHVFDSLRVTVLDTAGTVRYDNSALPVPAGNHLGRKEIKESIAKGSGYTVRRHSESTGCTYFYSATKFPDGTIIRTAVPYDVPTTELLKADYGFIWVMGAITVVICIFGYFATRRVGLLILRLNRFAESAERGERIYSTTPFPDDELGSISNHIVRLYANLQSAVAERDREHRAAMHEHQEKEKIKRRLTNNINHELKTPVAAIQVCVETLVKYPDMEEVKRMEFLHRCQSNVERLKRLLADVSLITRMEDGSAAISKECVDLARVIEDVVEDYRIAASDKGMEINAAVFGPMFINGNVELLESVFRNLIDNALAYSGGTIVGINAGASVGGDVITVTVEDNGCGVDAWHLPRLFERFYRVDKGRSRKAGGTGLGLSIVKNAVIFHNGVITVENRKSGGLRFSITFGNGRTSVG